MMILRKPMSQLVLLVFLLSTYEVYADTYYVSPNGSNTYPYDSWVKAKSSIQELIDEIRLVGGDTVVVDGGESGIVYPEEITITNSDKGSSEVGRVVFTLSDDLGHNGTVTIKPPLGSYRCLNIFDAEYVTITGLSKYRLIFDVDNCDYNGIKLTDSGGSGVQHCILEYIEVRNAWGDRASGGSGSAILVSGGSSDNIIRYSLVKNFGSEGSNLNHGIYNSEGVGNLYDDVWIHTTLGGYGFSIYAGGSTTKDVIVRNCRVDGYSTVTDRSGLSSGILLTSGTGHQAYNNLVWDWGEDGIYVKSGGDECDIWNNTSYNNGGYGVLILTGSGHEVKNNIIWQNGNTISTVGATLSNNLTTDPSFLSTDPSSDNFLKIGASSPARDAGTRISTFDTDILGTPRPSGAWDIGAYEYSGATSGPPTAAITLDSPSPIKSGSYQVILKISKIVTSVPSPLIFTGSDNSTTIVNLQGLVSGNSFSGTFVVDNNVAEGPGQFSLPPDTLVDENGNKGDEITSGAEVWIDKTPPSNPTSVRLQPSK